MLDKARTKYDAIVVGAGVAGSVVAAQLARGGWAVALVERQTFPRRKVCGECLSASNLPFLQALGVSDAFHASASAALRQVTLLRADQSVTAELPESPHPQFPWGKALGRETLDGLLLEQAKLAGAVVFQPWAAQAILGGAGAWHCEIRAADSYALLRLDAKVVIDAHGSWEDFPAMRLQRKLQRSAADLFAFKANFKGCALPEGVIHVLALAGGYGGMVVADGGVVTIACCIRRDRLSALRSAAPGLCVGDAVQAWLQDECPAVRQALQGAVRDGLWLTSGPLNPGARITPSDAIFRVGNAAGEAHPILGEGMSMALQSAMLLSMHLLGRAATTPVPDRMQQADVARQYAAAWHQEFDSRLRLAAIFAHVAMRPNAAALFMRVVHAWPALLTRGARWGGKVHLAPSLRSLRTPTAQTTH